LIGKDFARYAESVDVFHLVFARWLLFTHSSKLKNQNQGFLGFLSLFLYVVPKYTTDKKSDKSMKSS
jgi:hypothetical protein